MQEIKEYCGLPVTWKIPPVKTGDFIRFWYWDSDFKGFESYDGKIGSIRYLSAKPLPEKTKREYDIIRGNVLYSVTVKRSGNKYIALSFYNQRMSNVEKMLPPKER